MRVAVIGAGSWGTALAWLLGQKGLPVYLWGRDAEQIARIAAERVNHRYLPEARLPDTVAPTTESRPAAGVRGLGAGGSVGRAA
jgi:glycerol-3-phosphate dehydrogenase (NAD(P)+)